MDMLHTLMPHTDYPVLFPTNTSAPQLPLMESINCTSVKPKLMLNQKLTMADMDTDTQDTDTDMPVTDTELVTTATHTADTDTIINLLLNKPNFTSRYSQLRTLKPQRLFFTKEF